MRPKQAQVLVLVLIVIGGFVLMQTLRNEPLPTATETFIYDIDERAIDRVEVSHLGETQRFEWDETTARWVFDDEQRTPVSQDRWGGIPLLLSGPRVNRVLAVEQANLGRYGLDDPATVIRIDLADEQTITVFLGIATPDGQNDYAVREGSPQIALVDRSWGEVLTRLVTEPPYGP